MNFVSNIVFLAFCVIGNARIYRSIIWSPDNPIFKETKLRCVLPRSMQYILCPSLSLIVTDRDQQPKKGNLYENIWLVDRQSFETCKVGNTSKLLKKCNTPLTSSRFDIMFLDMHPLSGGLEFKFGKSYYIIATSNGTERSLANKEGGHCRSHSMKLQFYVCKDDQDQYCRSEENCRHLLDTPSTKPPTKNTRTVEHSTIHSTSTTRPPCNSTQDHVIPTTRETDIPGSSHYVASIEVFYRLGLAIMGLFCVVFISSTLFLAIRLYKFSKLHSNCKKYTAQLTRPCNGFTVESPNDSEVVLITTGAAEKA